MNSVTFFDCYKFKRKWIWVEMIIEDFSDRIDFYRFTVPEDGRMKLDWQVAYLEQYLNAEGMENKKAKNLEISMFPAF